MPKLIKKEEKEAIIEMKRGNYSNKEIAEKLKITEETVSKYVKPNKNSSEGYQLNLNLSEKSKAKIMTIAIKDNICPDEAVDKIAEYYIEGIHDENLEILEDAVNKVDNFEKSLKFILGNALLMSEISKWPCPGCKAQALAIPVNCRNCGKELIWGSKS